MSSNDRRVDCRTFVSAGRVARHCKRAGRIWRARYDSRGVPASRCDNNHGSRREQYLVDGLEIVTDNNVSVIVPPLYHEIVTATLNVPNTAAALFGAQMRLERALELVEAPYAPTAAGLTIVVGWGLSYFRSYLPTALVDAHLPIDLAYSAAMGARQGAA